MKQRTLHFVGNKISPSYAGLLEPPKGACGRELLRTFWVSFGGPAERESYHSLAPGAARRAFIHDLVDMYPSFEFLFEVLNV
eukprot:6182967-Pleurochrysis_carterae.AAC.7